MGCQSSLLNYSQNQGNKIQDEFKLNYRQFIMNTRGEVFEFYHFSTLIHRSIAGVIRKVYHRSSRVERVCKTIAVDNLKQLSCVQQIETLKNIDHPNVVKIQEYFIQKQFVYIIFEYIKGCTLQEQLTNLREISFCKTINIMRQLLSVVNMMHTQNLAHRSIHPSHIMLMNNNKNQQYVLKLIDFSYSSFAQSPKLKSPRPYKYQQAFNSQESQKFPLKHDIYCCGLIFIALLGGSKFLRGIRGKQEERIQQFMIAQTQIANLQPLLQGMLHKNPQYRLEASQVLKDYLFSANPNSKTYQKLILNNLRRCNIKGKLKSALWMFATIKLQSLYNKVQLMQQFYCLDSNKDGKIQPQQLSTGLMNTFNISKEEADQETNRIFQTIDKNSNGQMDFYQFVMGAYVVGKNLSDTQLKLLFNEIDLNGDGVIDGFELNEAIQGIDQYQLLAESGNKIDFNDFKKLMKSYIARLSGSE